MGHQAATNLVFGQRCKKALPGSHIIYSSLKSGENHHMPAETNRQAPSKPLQVAKQHSYTGCQPAATGKRATLAGVHPQSTAACRFRSR